MTDDAEATDLDPAKIPNSFKPLKGLIAAEAGQRSALWLAWHKLQIYATWAERLPTDESVFTALMGKSPAGYAFFQSQLDGNTIISKASSKFLGSTYNDIVNFASGMLSFAENLSPEDDQMLAAVKQLLDAGEKDDALTLLTDLQDIAQGNCDEAKRLQDALTDYKSELSKSTTHFNAASSALEKDEKTNSQQLEKLAGDEDKPGSIAHYRKLINEMRADYDHYVVVASTSPTYAWVWPVGTVSAIVVAGVYGDRAVRKLKELEEAQDSLAKASAELSAAYAARRIFEMGREGVDNASRFTQQAIDNLGTVQDAWKDLIKHIDEVKKWADKLTGDTDDGGKEARSLVLLKIYLGHIEDEWKLMVPMLKDLTTDLYSNVEPGRTTLSEFSDKVKHIAA